MLYSLGHTGWETKSLELPQILNASAIFSQWYVAAAEDTHNGCAGNSSSCQCLKSQRNTDKNKT